MSLTKNRRITHSEGLVYQFPAIQVPPKKKRDECLQLACKLNIFETLIVF